MATPRPKYARLPAFKGDLAPDSALPEAIVPSVEQADGHKDYVWSREYPQGYCLEEDVPAMLPKLSPRQRSYVRWRVKGKTLSGASKEVRASNETAQRWEAAPWWPLAEEIARAQHFGDVNATILPLMPHTLRRMQAELDLPTNNQIGHETMIWIAERVLGKPTQTTITKHDPTGSTMTEDIVAILKATASVVDRLPRNEQRRLSDAEVIEPDPAA